MDNTILFSVFTKSWNVHAEKLVCIVKELGFDGVEIPVRPGLLISPENCKTVLPRVTKMFSRRGLKIFSVAAPVDERIIRSCAECGIPVIRSMVRIPREKKFFHVVSKQQREWEKLIPILDKCHVQIGVQNHCNRFISNSMQLYYAVSPFDPKYIGIIWDAAHNSLQGEDTDIALDIVWSHLIMVNLKNAIRRPSGTRGCTTWKTEFTPGRHGFADWREIAVELLRRKYQGVVCLTAEYSDNSKLEEYVSEDLAYAKSLFSSETTCTKTAM